MTEPKTKKRVDWDAVEIAYSAGIKTLREMGTEFGCSEGAIRKKAKEKSWTRDLSAKIKAATEAKVRKAEYAEKYANSPEKEASELNQIEIGAKLQSDVILGHRKIIGKTRKITENLLKELEDDVDTLPLATKTGIINKLTQTIGTLTEAERKAFGIDSAYDPDKAVAEALTKLDPIDLARRVAFMLTKAVKEQ